MTEARPRALFLDLDGTLADSVPAMRAVYTSFLAEHGRTGTTAEFDELNGPALPEIIRTLSGRHRLEGTPAALEARYRALIAERYAAEARPAAGAIELLAAAAHARIDVWVVTSAERALAERFVDAHSLRGSIRGVITAEGLAASKPAPAIYQRALEVAGLQPAEVWVVEDSANGVRAAVAAGLCTYALAPAGSAPAGAVAISSLHDLVARLDPGCDVEPLPSGLRIVADATPLVLPPATSARVEQLWRDELVEHPSRFDGQLLALVERAADTLRGRFVPYRYLMAQRRDPDVAAALRIVPLAVTGVVVCDGAVGFATRTEKTTQYPGFLELVPSGGIDRAALQPDGSVDYTAQLLRELAEETGIAPALVRRLTPLALVRDRAEDVVDVAMRIDVAPEARAESAESAETADAGNDEYRSLRWVALDELGLFVSRHRERMVPASRVLSALVLARATASDSG